MTSRTLLLPALILTLMTAQTAFAQVQLDDNQRMACEAILCLAAPGSKPHECDRSLQHYYSIQSHKPSRQRNQRKSFLQLCPKQEGQDSAALDRIIDQEVGLDEEKSCSAEKLNRLYKMTYKSDGTDTAKLVLLVSPTMPLYCAASPAVPILPHYEGDPNLDYRFPGGGRWVD